MLFFLFPPILKYGCKNQYIFLSFVFPQSVTLHPYIRAVPFSNSDSDANNPENVAKSDGAGLPIEQPNLPDPGGPWAGLQQGGAGEGAVTLCDPCVSHSKVL